MWIKLDGSTELLLEDVDDGVRIKIGEEKTIVDYYELKKAIIALEHLREW